MILWLLFVRVSRVHTPHFIIDNLHDIELDNIMAVDILYVIPFEDILDHISCGFESTVDSEPKL